MVFGTIGGIVATSVFGLAAGSAGATIVGGLIGGGLAFGAQALLGQYLNRPKARPYGAVQGDIQIGGNIPSQAIYGKAKTKGHRLYYAKYNAGDEINSEVLVLSNGWCDGLEPYVYFYGKKFDLVELPKIGNEVAHYGIPDYWYDNNPNGENCFSIRFYDGRPGQQVDQRLVDETANLDTPWKATSTVAGHAYVVVRKRFDGDHDFAENGNPEIEFVLRGLREYDPRKDSTVAGGSGTHREDDPATHEWTENPALHRLNYQLGLRGLISNRTIIGEGKTLGQLDLGTYFAAMNVCDTLRNGKPTYACSLVVNADDDHTEVLKEFDDAMAGYGLNRRGLSGVIAGAPQLPVLEITRDDIPADRAKELRYRKSAFELYNHLSGQFTSIEDQWHPVSLDPIHVNADVAADGRVRQTSNDFLQVTDPDIAQYLLTIRYRQQRLGGRVTLPVSRRVGLAVSEGEWVEFEGREWLVQRWSVDEEFRFTLTLAETSANVYASEGIQPGPIVVPSSPPINPDNLPNVQNFAVEVGLVQGAGGMQTPALRFTWTPPGDAQITEIRFQYGPGTGVPADPFEDVCKFPERGEYVTTKNVEAGQRYAARCTITTDPDRFKTFSQWIVTAAATDVRYSSILDGSVVASKIADAAITADKLMNDAVTSLKLADEAVTETKLAVTAVSERVIASGAVVAEKLADLAVTQQKVAAGAISTSKLANGAVDGTKLADQAVDIAKFAAGLTPVEIVSALPVTENFEGRQAFFEGQLYRFSEGAWTKSIAAIDVAGDLSGGVTVGGTRLDTIKGYSYADGFRYGFEADEVHTIPVQTGNTLTPDMVDVFAGAQSMRINCSGDPVYIETDSGYDSDVQRQTVIVSIPTEPMSSFYGKRIKVTVFAKTPASNAATEFGLSFASGSGAGNSGWQYFTPTTAWEPYVFYYDVGIPGLITQPGGLVIWADTSGTGKGLLVDSVSIASSSEDFARDPAVQVNLNSTTIDGGKITTGSVTAAILAANAVTADKIAANAVTAGKIAAGAITASEIAAGAVQTENLAVGLGKNALYNSSFTMGLDGWASFSTADQTHTRFELRPTTSTYSGVHTPTLMLYQDDAVATGDVDVYNTPPGLSGLGQLYLAPLAVQAGDVVEASVYASAHRCRAELRLRFLDVNGNSVQYTGAVVNDGDSSGSGNPEIWPRLVQRAVAPTGAVAVCIHIRKTATSSGTNSYVFLHKPMLAKTVAGATEAMPWSDGMVTLIGPGGIQADAVRANHIKAGAVTAAKMAANTITANEIAAGAVAASELSANAVTADKVAANAMTTAALAAGAVTAEKIQAGTITGDKILGGTITGDKIAGSSITGDKMVAGSITARELIVTNWENLIPNGGWETADWDTFWSVSGSSANPHFVGGSYTKTGKRSLNLQKTTTSQSVNITSKDFIPVTGGETYYGETEVITNSGAQGAGFYFRVMWYDITKTQISTIDIANNAPFNGSWIKYSGRVAAPAGAAFALMRIYNHSTSNAGNCIIDRAILRRAMGGEIIVDGAITADKLAVNSVTANAIAAGAITTDKLAAGAITADKIAAGAITVEWADIDEAVINNLVVETSNIGFAAVTDQVTISGNTNDLTQQGNWETVDTINIDHAEGTFFNVIGSASLPSFESSGSNQARLLRSDGSIVWSGIADTSNRNVSWDVFRIDSGIPAGAYSYDLQFYKSVNGGSANASVRFLYWKR